MRPLLAVTWLNTLQARRVRRRILDIRGPSAGRRMAMTSESGELLPAELAGHFQAAVDAVNPLSKHYERVAFDQPVDGFLDGSAGALHDAGAVCVP